MTAGPLGMDDRLVFELLSDRPRVTWPGEVPVAVWHAPNVEHYDYVPPGGGSPQGRVPAPDPQHYFHRDSGNRTAFWRMLRIVDAYQVPSTASLSLQVLEDMPEVRDAMAERDWEVMSHGMSNLRPLTGMAPEAEEEFFALHHALADAYWHRPVRGMLGPKVSGTDLTCDLMARHGMTYQADWVHDEQPRPLRTRGGGRLVSLPYSFVLNDVPLVMARSFEGSYFVELVKAQVRRLVRAAQEDGQARVVCLATHPFVMAQPGMARHLEAVFEALRADDQVWLTRAGDITDHYLDHHYDAQLAHAETAAEEHAARVRGLGLRSPWPGTAAASSPPPTAATTTASRRPHLVEPTVANPVGGVIQHPVDAVVYAPDLPRAYDTHRAPWAGSALPAPDGGTGQSAALTVSVLVHAAGYRDAARPGSARPTSMPGGVGRDTNEPPPGQVTRLSQWDFGLSVGTWRLLDAAERAGVPVAVALDAYAALHAPGVAREVGRRAGEVVVRGLAANDVLTDAMTLEEEAEYVALSRSVVEGLTGRSTTGWFSPERAQSLRTPGVLARAGVHWFGEWPVDERPVTLAGAADGVCAVPFALETEDAYALFTRGLTVGGYERTVLDTVERLVADADLVGPRYLGLSLFGWVSGQGCFADTAERLLGLLAAHPRVVVVLPGEVRP